HRPDVIHAHWLLPQGLIAVLLRNTLRRRIPVVVTSHGADLYGWRGTVFRALKRLVVQRADKLVIVSRAMEEELASLGAKTECIALGPMGVDLRKRFTPVGATAKSGCEILFVGRLVEKKGLRNLIEAMPAIRAAVPAARLTIAGFGPEEPACK